MGWAAGTDHLGFDAWLSRVVWAYVGLIAAAVLGGIVYLRVEARGLVAGLVTSLGFLLFIVVLTMRSFAKNKDSE